MHIKDKSAAAAFGAAEVERLGFLTVEQALHLSVELKAVRKAVGEGFALVQKIIEGFLARLYQEAHAVAAVLAQIQLALAAEVGVGFSCIFKHEPRRLGTGKG